MNSKPFGTTADGRPVTLREARELLGETPEEEADQLHRDPFA